VGKRVRKIKSDPAYDRAFGMRIRECREELGWSQVDLASHSSISSTQISVIENGHESPQLYTVVALAVAFGKTPSELLDFEYTLNLNRDFSSARKPRKAGVTDAIRKLFAENFFKSPRTVQDVIHAGRKKYGITLMSAEASGALLYLVGNGSLKKIRSGKSKNLYQNR